MNTLLLEAIDSLINDDDDTSAEYIRQALVQKMRTKMGLNEASDDCVEQLKSLLNDSRKKKEFLNVVTEIFNFNLQGYLEEFSDSLGEYDSKQIEETYNSLVDESLWDDCFDELADNIITEVEQSDLDVEIPEEFKSCLAQLKSNELQKLLDEYKTEIHSLYSKSKTAKMYADVTVELSDALNDE